MKTFSEFKQKGNIRVIMLTNDTTSDTALSLIDACKKKHLACNIINIENVSLNIGEDTHIMSDSKTTVDISQDSTVFLLRRGALTDEHTKGIVKTLEKQGYFCINSLESMDNCENKFLTAEILETHGLPIPKYALVPNENFLDSALEKVGGKFPIIMKLLSGTQGIGVSIIDSYASFKSVYQTLKKVSPSSEILIQEKIESDYDIRIQVITNHKLDPAKIMIGAMKRGKIEKDFRTNYSLGGEVSPITLTKEIEEIAFKAANAVGCIWCGVDIIVDKKTKKPYILEVNSSPGVEGISKVLKKSVFKDVLDFVEHRHNWTFSTIKSGYLEMMTIDGIGDMVAKFDTGNSSLSCTLHADKVEEKGGQLLWEVKGKKFKHKIVDYSNSEIGKEKIQRPIIEIDIIFNKRLFTGVRVSPSDRGIKSTPFLVNRKFMRYIGVVIDPHSTFVVSGAPEGYNPMDAKKDVHAGIYLENENGEEE
jgi:RimK family alpha-L-glutamate ligase